MPCSRIALATYLSPTSVRKTFMPSSCRHSSKARLLIFVATIAFLVSNPFSNMYFANIAKRASPLAILPFSSQTTKRSASPSNAIPKLAFLFFTSFCIACGFKAPQSLFMFRPFGLTFKTKTSAPSSANTFGAIA